MPLTKTWQEGQQRVALPAPALPDTTRSVAAHYQWQDQAACRGMDVNDFFPEKDWPGVRSSAAAASAAKATCATCPVRLDCLTHALAFDERHGVWGETSAEDRRKIRRQRDTTAA